MTPTLLELVINDLGQPVKSRPAGDFWPCPFNDHEHDHTAPGFHVWTDRGGKQWFKCPKCDQWGDAAQWLTSYRGVDQRQALAILRGQSFPARAVVGGGQLAKRPHIAPPAEDWQDVAWNIVSRAGSLLQQGYNGHGEAVGAANWLASRGITATAAGKHGLGFNPHWLTTPVGKLPPGVVIPCDEGGEMWYIKVRLTKAVATQLGYKYHALPGSRPVALFNSATLLASSKAVVVEGELDAVLGQELAPAGVAVVTMGSATNTASNWQWLRYFAAVGHVAIAGDVDGAGAAAVAQWLQRLPYATAAPPFPKGKDLTEFWAQAGATAVANWLSMGV